MIIEHELHKILNNPENEIIKTGIQAALDDIHQKDAETILTKEQKHSIIRDHIQKHRDRTAQLILSGDITTAEQENTIALQLSYALPQGPSPEELRQLIKNAIRDENTTSEPEDVEALVTKYSDTFGVSPRYLKTVVEAEFADRKAHAARVALAGFLDKYGVPSESIFEEDSVRHTSVTMDKHLDQVKTLLDTEVSTVEKLVLKVEQENLVAYVLKEPCASVEPQATNDAVGAKIFEFDVPQELGSRRFTTDNVTNEHLTDLLNDSAQALVDLGIVQSLLGLRGAVNLDYQKLREVRDQLTKQLVALWADDVKHKLSNNK